MSDIKGIKKFLWMRGPKRLWTRPCGVECGAKFPDGSPDTLHNVTLTRLALWVLR